MPQALTDQELINAARRGCRESLRNFIARHLPAVRMFFKCRQVSYGEEEDLTQETFIRVIRSLDRVEANPSAVSWIMTIARNLLIDRWRGQGRRNADPPAPVPDPTFDSPERRVVAKLTLDELLQTLGPEDRLLIELRLLRDLSAQEAAQILEITENNVNVRLFRILQRLRTRLGKEESRGA